jgi:hypothetical protein
MVDVTNFQGNYLDGQYVGAFSEVKPFGPHVRKCVCMPCHKAYLAASKARMDAIKRSLTPEQWAERDAEVLAIIESLKNEEPKTRKPAPAKVEVGTRVVVRSQNGVSLNEGRIGTVVEMPGPSTKYNGQNAQRIEVLLDSTVDYEFETMWTDNNQWGWLELA